MVRFTIAGRLGFFFAFLVQSASLAAAMVYSFQAVVLLSSAVGSGGRMDAQDQCRAMYFRTTSHVNLGM